MLEEVPNRHVVFTIPKRLRGFSGTTANCTQYYSGQPGAVLTRCLGKECGVFAVVQRMSDADLATCPQCKDKGKQSSVERRISRTSFQLVGSGWYASDYKSSGGASSSTTPVDIKDTTPKDSGTETKPEKNEAAPAKCGGGCSCH